MLENKLNPYSQIENEELLKIKKVLLVFSEYLKVCKTLDVVLCKAGYLLIHLYINPKSGEIDVTDIPAELVVSAEELCDTLAFNIAQDVLDVDCKKGHPMWECNEEEKAAISQELKPYFQLLPEYRHLEKKLYMPPQWQSESMDWRDDE